MERRRAVRTRRRAGGGDLAHRWRGRVLRTCVAGPRPPHRDPRGRDGPVPRVQPAAFGAAGGRRRAPGPGPPDARRVDASPGRRGDRRTRLARERSGVRPVPDRAPDGAARRVRGRERGARRRRVRRRCDPVPARRGRGRRHRHDPPAPRGRERAAAGDLGGTVDGGGGRCAGPVHPRPVAAGMDRRRPLPLARRPRARRSRSSSPSRPRSAGTGRTDESPPRRRRRGGRRDGLRPRRLAHARDPGLGDPARRGFGGRTHGPADRTRATRGVPGLDVRRHARRVPSGAPPPRRDPALGGDRERQHVAGPVVVGAGRGGGRPASRLRDPARGRGGRARGVRAVPAARRPVGCAGARRGPGHPGREQRPAPGSRAGGRAEVRRRPDRGGGDPVRRAGRRARADGLARGG